MATASWSALASLPSQVISGPNFGTTASIKGGTLTLATGASTAGTLVSEDATGRAAWTPIWGSTAPTATVSGPTGVSFGGGFLMVGCGSTCTFTPSASGKCFVSMKCTILSDTAANTATVAASYGTGTAPVNGAAATGTVFGPTFSSYVAKIANLTNTHTSTAVLSLTPSTAYWFDFQLKNQPGGTGSSSVCNCEFRITELV